jgi:hypothetical protein
METFENYLNILIFLFIAKGSAVLLVMLLLFEWGRKLSYVIVTVIIGMAAVVVIVMFKIAALDSSASNAKSALAKSPPALNSCPEYHVRRVDELGVVKCHNVYTTPDGRYTYTIKASAGGTTSEDLNVTELLASSKTMEDLCRQSATYQQYPWTEFKAKCNKL